MVASVLSYPYPHPYFFEINFPNPSPVIYEYFFKQISSLSNLNFKIGGIMIVMPGCYFFKGKISDDPNLYQRNLMLRVAGTERCTFQRLFTPAERTFGISPCVFTSVQMFVPRHS